MAGRHHVSGRLRAGRARAALAGVGRAGRPLAGLGGARLALAGVAMAVALLVVVAAAWPRAGGPAPTAAVGPATSPAPTAAATGPERAADRPSRGGAARAAPPQESPSPPQPPPERSGEPAPSAGQPDQSSPNSVPDGGQVVTTGTCEASYYWEPQPTASGEVFDPEAMTAAHKTWDFGTRVRVINPANGQSVVVRINDRGPYIDGRCLDLARGAFREIASLNQGVVTVTYEVLSD